MEIYIERVSSIPNTGLFRVKWLSENYNFAPFDPSEYVVLFSVSRFDPVIL